MEIIFFAIGILAGMVLAWFVLRHRFSTDYTHNARVQELYVSRSLYDQLQSQADLLRDDLLEKEQEIRTFEATVAAKKQTIIHLEERLDQQKEEVTHLQEKMQSHFEQIASKLLEEKSQRFTTQNQVQMNGILEPLKERIKDFENNIERKYIDETKERISLRQEIEHLRSLNQRLSTDANNLARALKGDSKTQGDWGEVRLEIILEKAGLEKGIHFRRQESFVSETTGNMLRPDFVVNLPEGKHLIIDSKVSLTAFEAYTSSEDEQQKIALLKAHLDSFRNHYRDLGSKNYQHLYQIHSPDYVLMFVPIEPAFALAVQTDQQLFLDALDRNVVLVTSSTLLATMRTVSFIWKQERQKRNAQEIAKQSGQLYDKFCGFVEDLKTLGKQLEQARTAYDAAFNKLSDSKQYGTTLIGRAERLRELGAKSTKSLPPELLDGLE